MGVLGTRFTRQQRPDYCTSKARLLFSCTLLATEGVLSAFPVGKTHFEIGKCSYNNIQAQHDIARHIKYSSKIHNVTFFPRAFSATLHHSPTFIAHGPISAVGVLEGVGTKIG